MQHLPSASHVLHPPAVSCQPTPRCLPFHSSCSARVGLFSGPLVLLPACTACRAELDLAEVRRDLAKLTEWRGALSRMRSSAVAGCVQVRRGAGGPAWGAWAVGANAGRALPDKWHGGSPCLAIVGVQHSKGQ